MKLAAIVGSVALTLAYSTSAPAAMYSVTIDGDFTQSPGSIIAFGLEDRVIPFHAGFMVDTDSVAPTTFPAGTPVYYAGSFQTDLQLVPRPGAIGFWLTVGNATFYSLQTMQFGSTGLTFDALLEGDFRAPTGISVTAVGTYGTFQTGGYICNETGCGFIRTGSAFSARDGGFGKVSNVQVRVRLMTNSPQTAIADLFSTGEAGGRTGQA